VKIIRENSVFRGKRKLFKILKDNKCIQYSEFRHTLFFRASKSCSNTLNVKRILNTVKNSMTNSVFRASANSSKILKDKNISKRWKISRQTLFFRACASCSKFWMIKNVYIQHSEFRAHSVFQGKPQVAQKSWKIKNIST